MDTPHIEYHGKPAVWCGWVSHRNAGRRYKGYVLIIPTCRCHPHPVKVRSDRVQVVF